MAIRIETEFDSAVIQSNKDVFTKSYIENGTTIIEFDLRKRDYQKVFDIKSKIYWREPYTVDVHEFSTYQNPIVYRFHISQGYYFKSKWKRIYFTPTIDGVSTQQHVSKSVIRLSCFLAVICGVTLRNIALIFSVLFHVPVTKSSIKRWIDEIGSNLPTEEEILKQLIERKEPHECHIDGYYPLGTQNCVMVIKDEYDRILITHESESENKENAKKFLEKIKKAEISIHFAFSDYSKSFIEAIKEVFPGAKFQADHFHTVKNIWKHLKKGLLEYRREIKEAGKNKNDEQLLEFASKLWELRWSLLKKHKNLSEDERIEIESIETEDTGFIKKFRGYIRQLVNIFDHSNSELTAEIKLRTLRKQIDKTENKHLLKIPKFFDDHWNQAMHYLKKKGPGKYRRSSNSESGMRILRRLERNHDGIRTESSRKNYVKIYQTIKYLSVDITDFLNSTGSIKPTEST